MGTPPVRGCAASDHDAMGGLTRQNRFITGGGHNERDYSRHEFLPPMEKWLLGKGIAREVCGGELEAEIFFENSWR